MAIFPGAVIKLIPRHNKPLHATQLILHTAVSPAQSLYGYFSNPSTDVCSHFYVREDGTVEQYIDTRFQAPANRNANVSAISVETWDDGKPNTTPWNVRQMVALAAIAVWARAVHDVPLRLCSSPTSPGVGWHSMWGAPSAWTPAAGKTCPGPARIPQVAAVVAAAVAPQPEGLFKTLTPQEEQEVLRAARAINRAIDTQLTSKVDGKTQLWLTDFVLWNNKIITDIAKKLGI